MLNFTRWLPEELDGQEHCIGLPPSGNTTCTMMMSQQVKLASALPGGGTGAVLTLSQSPCNDPSNPGACCNAKGTTCAKWAGAHLVSAGCIQWGVLEIEAAFNMPANAGGFYFTVRARRRGWFSCLRADTLRCRQRTSCMAQRTRPGMRSTSA